MSKQDNDALVEALMAIEGALHTLVMARTIIEDRIEGANPVKEQPKNPVAVMGQETTEAPSAPPMQECEHEDILWDMDGQGLCRRCGDEFTR